MSMYFRQMKNIENSRRNMKFLLKNLSIIGLLLLVFVQFGLAQNRAKQVENLLEKGEGYLEDYEFEKAVAVCDEALQKIRSAKPQSPKKLAAVYYLYGRIYEEGLYLDKAIEYYTKALKFDARNVFVYESRSQIYEYIGETAKASDDLAKAEKLISSGKTSVMVVIGSKSSVIPADRPALIEYIETFKKIEFQEVAGFIEGFIFEDLDKNGVTSYEEIQNNYISQLRKINRLVKFNPKSDLALWKRGSLFLEMNEISNQLFWVSAEVDFANAYDLNPRYEYLVNRGVVRARRDNKTNYEFAIIHFTDAIKLNNKCVEAYYNRGLAYLKLNENEKAIADFSEVIKLNTTYPLAYKSRAKAFRNVVKATEAEADEAMLKKLGGK